MALKFAAVNIVMVLVTMFHCTRMQEEPLEPRYQLIPGLGYYKLNRNQTEWQDAQNSCLQEGGQLVIINSQEEANALIRLFSKGSTELYYLAGFHDQFIEGVHVTTTGILLNHAGYAKYGKPVVKEEADNKDCGAIDGKTGILFDVRCNETYYFMCEQQLWVDYEYYEDMGYYKLHTEAMTWVHAYETCEKEGTHLAVINSETESTLISKMLGQHPNIINVDDNNVVMVGFSMVFDTRNINGNSTENGYVTIQGQSIEHAGFSNWYLDQPDPGTQNHCGALTRNGTLSMVNCSKFYAFVCEHEI